MSGVKVTKLSVNQLRRQGATDAIWVLNGTMKNPKNRANVYVALPARDGEVQDPIVIFATWVPVCVTDKIDRDHLLRSRNFLLALERENLIAIPEEEALKMLAMPGAKEEQDRVRQLDIASATGDAMGSIEEESSVEIQMPDGDTMQDDPVSPAVHQFIGLMESASGVEALNSLRNLGDLSVDEYQAISKEARGLGEAYKEVVAHCSAKLRELRPSQGDAPISAGGQSRRVI